MPVCRLLCQLLSSTRNAQRASIPERRALSQPVSGQSLVVQNALLIEQCQRQPDKPAGTFRKLTESRVDG
jgi:hypothetical protein